VKNLPIALGIWVVLVSPAFATDAMVEIPEDVSPTFSWTGGYVGIQVGSGWANVDRTTGTFGNSYGADGFLGGVHTGYNHQFGSLVLGIEGDIELSGLGGNDGGAGGTMDSVDMDWMGSIRARAGFALGRALIYGTAGVAFADVDQVNRLGIPVSFSDTYTGWTAGAGAEYAFTDSLTGRVEYRYTDFGSKDYAPGRVVAFRNDITMHGARIGLSYKF
jgi:outer membrane immunogenic protein